MKQKDSLRFLFAPRTIAVVGASNKEGKMGNLFVRNLLAGSPASIFPVHPTEREIAGVTAYPDINAIPETLDLVIPLVPGEQLVPLVRSWSKGKVKYLLAIPSGFAETASGICLGTIIFSRTLDSRYMGNTLGGQCYRFL